MRIPPLRKNARELPPRNPADWKFGDPDNLPGSEPAGKRKK